MYRGSCTYVKFKYERLSLFCFYCGRLGHSDSFCEGKMALSVEVTELGWDLSLRAQSRRALSMNSVWLREKGEGRMKGNKNGDYMKENFAWIAGHKNQGCRPSIDPVLGICLEGNAAFLKPSGKS
ncbi:hypothetical protein PVK06_017565 [Gossypium arboreum]|uniref:Zinc knuckle CX2CX4HX4C domain-containing protein n=1 Tax=Gossypium arboreum TaxID=29729 RepID=A0ABR0Q3B3_GOSAR|nr:hypothetical protein PVK06_017565 [Gossypium arboreum]